MLDVLHTLLQYAVAPLAALVVWIYKTQHERIASLEKRVSEVEMNTAVISNMIDNIKDDIKEIKTGINKLVDRK